MSRYNTYAQRLDTTFRSARDEYAAAYGNLVQARRADTDAKAWRPNDTAEDKQLRTATAALDLSKAEAEFKIADGRIWSEFDMKCKELRKELEKDVQKNSLANPDAIDANALELLKSGALTVEDYSAFSEKYSGNSTMLKLVAKYALEASEKTDDVEGAAALRILSDNCKTGMGTVLRAWNELEGLASYCSGCGGSSRTAIDPTHIYQHGKMVGRTGRTGYRELLRGRHGKYDHRSGAVPRWCVFRYRLYELWGNLAGTEKQAQ